jgi:Ca2+-transporting ATPase
VFKTEALGVRDLCTLLGLAGVSMGLHEGRRMVERKVNAEDTYGTVTEGLV